MKAKMKVPEKKVTEQCAGTEEATATANQLTSKLPQTATELRRLQYEIGGIVSPLLLLARVLSTDDDNLELKGEDDLKVNVSSVGMASAEVLEVYASKLHVLVNDLDSLSFELDHIVKVCCKPEGATPDHAPA